MSNIKQVTEVPTDQFNDLERKVDALYKKAFPTDDEVITTEEAAAILNQSVTTIRRKKNLIGFIENDGILLFYKKDVMEYLRKRYRPASNNVNQVAKSVWRAE